MLSFSFFHVHTKNTHKKILYLKREIQNYAPSRAPSPGGGDVACARRARDVSRAAANENEECLDKHQNAAVAVARYIDSTEHLAFSTTRRTRARRKRETQRRRGSAEESRGGADER